MIVLIDSGNYLQDPVRKRLPRFNLRLKPSDTRLLPVVKPSIS